MMYGPDDLVCPILVWREADYERAKALSDDEMPDTYADWQEKFRELFRALPAGAKIVKIEADPDEVAEWCRSQGLKITSPHRAKWAVIKFSEMNGIKGGGG